MTLSGKSIIAGERGEKHAKVFRAFDPRTGKEIEPVFYSAAQIELENAADSAAEARVKFGDLSGKKKAEFLRQIAANIETLGDILIERASLETALPITRIQSERGRTCAQLRLFADVVEEGSWVDARIDLPDPDRTPLPKPDVRSMMRPVGPVAVFCASNFPLAFSVAGGDTASALAAGCPVIVVAHTAHPGTAELVGLAITEAIKTCGLPKGVFSLLFSADYEIGRSLVQHPEIKAVGFTGSRSGGRALMEIAAARPVPIPVYAEMSSINPVFILPGALAEKAKEIAAGLHASFTLGVGQFCTKPGLVILPDSSSQHFVEKLKELTCGTMSSPLLTPGIRTNYEKATAERSANLSAEKSENEIAGFSVNAYLFQTSAEKFLHNAELGEEIFGPTTLLINADNREEVLAVARSMEGQLTASIFGTEDDLKEFAGLIRVLETKVGRLIFNAFPTGVEVCHAMVHRGPYPATSDSRSTSVGTRAIERFSRPVCYQGFPQENLPDELRDENPLGIWRMVDGNLVK